MLLKVTKDFCFQNLKPISEGSLFSNENYFKLLPYLANWISFPKIKLRSKLTFDPKTFILSEIAFTNGF
jgi:hypothetical protein